MKKDSQVAIASDCFGARIEVILGAKSYTGTVVMTVLDKHLFNKGILVNIIHKIICKNGKMLLFNFCQFQVHFLIHRQMTKSSSTNQLESVLAMHCLEHFLLLVAPRLAQYLQIQPLAC